MILNYNKMGLCASGDDEKKKSLVVATLNYCGIMNSPFEFYCDDYLIPLQEISNHFLNIIPLYFPDFQKDNFQWKFGKIDAKFRHRYSPMFFMKVGIDESKNIVMGVKQFQQKWEQVFSTEIPPLNIKYTPQEKQVTKKYDMTMWHTLLRYVYGVQNLKEAQGLSADKYISKLKPMYNLSFLDQGRKCHKVLDNFRRVNADVLFFQQYSKGFFQAISKMPEFYFSHDATRDTLIIAKKKSFRSKPESSEVTLQTFAGKQLKERLMWSDRTSFMIIDKIIFINAHLNSKADKNKQQVDIMKQAVSQLKKKMKGYEIVLGGDLNSYVDPFSSEFNFFPEKNDQMTTVKKRTFTQGQYHKADKIIRQSKDKIISTMKINKGRISYITGEKPSDTNLMPTEEHPFDHFVVTAHLSRQT